jgi:hypothetical protein
MRSLFAIIGELPSEIASQDLKTEIQQRLAGEGRNIWKTLAVLLNGKTAETQTNSLRLIDGQKIIILQRIADTVFDEDEMSWRERISWCETPDDFLKLFQLLGIPSEEWRSGKWLTARSKLPTEEGGIGKSLNGLATAIREDERFGSYPTFVAWMDGKDAPDLSWPKRVAACNTPEDFLRLFEELQIPDERWKSSSWLQVQSKLPREEGGVGESMNSLGVAIRNRFGSHPQFVAWMEGKEKPDISVRERIQACTTREDYLQVFRDLGIPGEEWKNSRWLERTSGLPPEEGGINLKLAHVVQYIRGKEEFGSFPQFVAWMEGKEKPDDYLTVRIKACLIPADFFALFKEIGVPENEWENTKWFMDIARLPVEEGGIGRNLVGFISAIRKDQRFGSYRKFVAWMYGKDAPEPSMAERVRACKTPDDFKTLFNELGISEERWRSSEWLSEKAKLPVEEGGVGRSMSGFLGAIRIDKRFKSYPKFVAWMDGKTEPPKSWPKRIAACQTQADFLSLFNELGIPDEKWRNVDWLSNIAKKPPEEGGIGTYLAGLYGALKSDSRFESFPAFVAWMDGKELVKETSWSDRIAACQTREDFQQLLTQAGVTGDEWKVGKWLVEMSRLPIEEGGIGKPLQGFEQAIRKDPRFLSYTRFVRWMEGQELPADYVKTKRQQFADRIRACLTPDDFRAYFAELGIPGEEWRNTSWLGKTKKSPDQQGPKGNLAGLARAIGKDERFKSFRNFVAWMDGTTPQLNNKERVTRCQKPEDFLALFVELEVPGDTWRNRAWFTDIAKLPPEQGGIGKEGLTSLPQVIADDPRFGSFPNFIAWMDGREKADDPMIARAQQCQTREDFLTLFTELGVTDDKWKNGQWLRDKAQLPPEEGGIGRSLIGINQGIIRDSRFVSHRKFVAWMEGEEELDNEILAAETRKCQGAADYMRLFTELGIPGGKWRVYSWLVRTAASAPEQGGIGKPVEGMLLAIREKFDSYKKFVTWMDGDDGPKETWKARIAGFETPDDFLLMFEEIGIPGDQWRNSSWVNRTALLSLEEGGISKPLQGMCIAICERFGNYRQFVAWMDGKEKPDPNFRERLRACQTREDFLQLFRELGIEDDSWKSHTWRLRTAHLTKEEGGIGRKMSSFSADIASHPLFESVSHFISWMEGKGTPQLSFPKRIANCQTREDFLQWFTELGIPGEFWKDGPWLATKAKLPSEEGGIGKSMTALLQAIRSDERFGSYPQFIAWMEGKEKAEESMPKRVSNCQTPDDFLQLFTELGIPDKKWRNTNWMRNIAPLSSEEGGIGKNFAALCSAIRLDQRFGDYRQFVAWMDGKEKPDLTIAARVRACQTREDFLALFADLGIPDGAWRRGKWLFNIAKLPPEQGGIGKNLSSLASCIQSDERFGSHRYFVAWMDGHSRIDTPVVTRVRACQIPADFLKLFSELGIPGDAWRSTAWFRELSGRPKAERPAGITGIPHCIANDGRFASYIDFVAWMDGVPLEGITSDLQAHDLLANEAARLGVTVDMLLHPDSTGEFRKQSHVLRKVLDYFASKNPLN